MSSSDQLKRAAAKLRETAAKATPGPWQFVPDLYGDRGAITSASPAAEGWDTLIIDVPNDSEQPAAEWIALVSPALAEPLAVVLEEAARRYEWFVESGAKPEHAAPTMEYELAVARALLGEGS